jgi:hypothetical protein
MLCLFHSLLRRRRKSRSAATVKDQSCDNNTNNNDNDVILSLVAASVFKIREPQVIGMCALDFGTEKPGEHPQ